MITGIEILKFGVEDRAASNKFLADFGLKQSQSDIEGTDLYQTQNGSKIYLFDCDDHRLPKAIESGSTLREVTWGLDDAAQDLANLAFRLNDVEGYQATADMVQCLDPNGMTIRFQKSFTQDLPALKTEGINQYGNVQRVNAASPVYDKGQPVAIGHVVFFTPDLAKTEQFYIEKLGFFLSDAYRNRGAFLRCRGKGFHHDLFLLQYQINLLDSIMLHSWFVIFMR